MTPEQQAELELNIAADPDNGPIYLAAIEQGGHGSRIGLIVALAAAVLVYWLLA